MPTLLRQQAYPFGSLRKDPHWSVQGLIFYPNFRPAGLRLIDESHHGNHGTITWATWVGNGLYFNGSGDNVDMGDILDSGLEDFTIIAWINTTTSSDGYIFVKTQHAFNDEDGFGLRIKASGVLAILFSDGTAITSHDTTTSINDGQWHQVVMTVTRGDRKRAYVDGVEVYSRDISGMTGTQNNAVTLKFGKPGANNIYFDGEISDAKMYNRALIASEIKQLYLNPNLPMQQPPIWLFMPPVVGVTMAAHYYRHLMQGVA